MIKFGNVYFDKIDLEDSIINSWSNENGVLKIEIEASLIKTHPKFQKPKKNERSFYIEGTLIFNNVINISGMVPMEYVTPFGYADGTKDYDVIHCLWKIEDGFYLEAEFGEVTIKCDMPILILKDDNEIVESKILKFDE